MNTTPPHVSTSTEQPTGRSTGALRKSSIGVLGMVLMVVAATAPLTALSANFTLSFALGAGEGTVGLVLVVAVVLLIFTFGYLAIARTVTNSGAYYAYIEYGLGRGAGGAAALIATVTYNAGVAAMAAITSYFIDVAVTTYAGVDLPWWMYAVVVVALTALLGHRGLGWATKAVAVVCGVEVLVVLALAVAVPIENPGGFTAATLAPATVFGGNIGLTVVMVLLSYAGYEASATYSEEAGDAARQVSRATYLSLAVLTVIFVAATWSIVAASGDVAGAAAADPGGLVTSVITSALGGWLGPVVAFLIPASFFGATVAFHNMASRYLFSLGRAGLLPRRLAGTHARHSTPTVAVAVQLGVVAILLVPFALTGLDPLVSLVPAVGGVTSLGLILLMTLCSVSVVAAAVRGTLAGSTWSTRIAPVVAALLLVGCGVLILTNYTTVTGSTSPVVNSAPVLLAVGAVYGALVARRQASTVRLDLAVG